MTEPLLLDQKQHLTAPGTPDSMSETEIDESKTGICWAYFPNTFAVYLSKWPVRMTGEICLQGVIN